MTNNSAPDIQPDDMKDEAPPVMGTWSRLYCLVLGELAVCIILFYIFTEAFS